MSSGKVYVGNLPHSGVEEEDLRKVFETYGALKDVWIARKPPGFAFVTFADPHDAQDAVEKVKDQDFKGNPLRVEISSGAGRRDRGDRRDDRRDRDRDYDRRDRDRDYDRRDRDRDYDRRDRDRDYDRRDRDRDDRRDRDRDDRRDRDRDDRRDRDREDRGREDRDREDRGREERRRSRSRSPAGDESPRRRSPGR